MKTTFELQHSRQKMSKKAIIGPLSIMENIWNIKVDTNTACISFEYMTLEDLEKVRWQLQELGYVVINDTHHLDHPESA